MEAFCFIVRSTVLGGRCHCMLSPEYWMGTYVFCVHGDANTQFLFTLTPEQESNALCLMLAPPSHGLDSLAGDCIPASIQQHDNIAACAEAVANCIGRLPCCFAFVCIY